MKNIPFVITEDIRSMSRFGDFTTREIVAKYVTQSTLLNCEKFITRDIIVLNEATLTDWVTKNAPKDAVIQTTAYTEKITSPYSHLQLA